MIDPSRLQEGDCVWVEEKSRPGKKYKGRIEESRLKPGKMVIRIYGHLSNLDYLNILGYVNA